MINYTTNITNIHIAYIIKVPSVKCQSNITSYIIPSSIQLSSSPEVKYSPVLNPVKKDSPALWGIVLFSEKYPSVSENRPMVKKIIFLQRKFVTLSVFQQQSSSDGK